MHKFWCCVDADDITSFPHRVACCVVLVLLTSCNHVQRSPLGAVLLQDGIGWKPTDPTVLLFLSFSSLLVSFFEVLVLCWSVSLNKSFWSRRHFGHEANTCIWRGKHHPPKNTPCSNHYTKILLMLIVNTTSLTHKAGKWVCLHSFYGQLLKCISEEKNVISNISVKMFLGGVYYFASLSLHIM